MKEAFYEESVSSSRAAREAKLYTAFRVVSIVLFVLAAVQIPIALSNISMAVTAYTDPPEGVTPITGMGLAYTVIVRSACSRPTSSRPKGRNFTMSFTARPSRRRSTFSKRGRN